MLAIDLSKKDLHDPDNHDGVITHLEQDILECEAKWALESITMNKALTFSSPVPLLFSKFFDMLNAALEQHYLLGF